jgi:mRNA-degrading endonuclease RelE of RelBE toxin-antitoxin system
MIATKKRGGVKMTKTPHQWLIEFSQESLEQLRALPSRNRLAVFRVLRRLLQADNPLAASGVKKVKGTNSQFRARAGDYRILFTISARPATQLKRNYKGTLTVEVIGHRRHVYGP